MWGRSRELVRALERNNELLVEVREEIKLNREAFEGNRGALERNREAFERNREAFEQNREAFEDLRTFTRDLTRRNEVVWRGVVEELRVSRTMLTETLTEMRDQLEANTKAVLSVLDRLDNGGSTSSA